MSTIKLATCLNGHEPILASTKELKNGRISYNAQCACTGGPNKPSIPMAESAWNTLIRKLVEQSIPKEDK